MFMYFDRRYSRPITDIEVRNKTLVTSPECRYLLVNWSNSHPYAKPGYPVNDMPLSYGILYQHSAHLPNGPVGEQGIVAQLVLLLPPDINAVASQPTERK